MHVLRQKQRLPISRMEAWNFLSDPGNLADITPGYMGFDIKHGASEIMYAGQIIEYIVRPIFGIPLRWVTEITHVEPGRFFVDEQRLGPYSFWHHQHFVHSVKEGVELEDLVHYQLPLGPIGRFLHSFMVRPRLEKIFAYRAKILDDRYGKIPFS